MCLAAHLLSHLAQILTLAWATCTFQKHSISSECNHHKPMLIGLANVSQTLLPIFTQNQIFIRCSGLLLVFLPTLHHKHALLPLPLGNEWVYLVCSWCKRKLDHVQTSSGAWVCLSRHPQSRTVAIPGIKLSHYVHVWSEVFLVLVLMITIHASFHFMSNHSISTVPTYICKNIYIYTCFRNFEIKLNTFWYISAFISFPDHDIYGLRGQGKGYTWEIAGIAVKEVSMRVCCISCV